MTNSVIHRNLAYYGVLLYSLWQQFALCKLLRTEYPSYKKECTMIVSYSITKDQKPTLEQIAETREAAKRPIVFDEDCPEMTDEQLKQFKRVLPLREDPNRKLG